LQVLENEKSFRRKRLQEVNGKLNEINRFPCLKTYWPSGDNRKRTLTIEWSGCP